MIVRRIPNLTGKAISRGTIKSPKAFPKRKREANPIKLLKASRAKLRIAKARVKVKARAARSPFTLTNSKEMPTKDFLNLWRHAKSARSIIFRANAVKWACRRSSMATFCLIPKRLMQK